MAGKAFDIWLIPEFPGISSAHTASEWKVQVELVCKMCGVDNIERIIPLRLRGEALLMYRQLTHVQREDMEQARWALLVAFALDPFVVFDLACLVGEGLSNWWLICAFVSGLPSHVRQQLWASSRKFLPGLKPLRLKRWLISLLLLLSGNAGSSLVYLWTHLHPSQSKDMDCSAMSAKELITLQKSARSLERPGKVVK